MSVSTTNSHGPIVTPVIDYEPPVVGSEISTEPCAARPAALHRPTRSGRHLHAVAHPVEVVPSERLRLAAAFTDAALRSILEVMDRRRPAVQLRPLLAGGLADTVASFTRGAPTRQAAVLRKVRLQAVVDNADGQELAYEASASYSRGKRVHAMACRVQRVATPRGERWQVVALHIG
ncbi:Rv3235 family protein [soil metagenome]